VIARIAPGVSIHLEGEEVPAEVLAVIAAAAAMWLEHARRTRTPQPASWARHAAHDPWRREEESP